MDDTGITMKLLNSLRLKNNRLEEENACLLKRIKELEEEIRIKDKKIKSLQDDIDYLY